MPLFPGCQARSLPFALSPSPKVAFIYLDQGISAGIVKLVGPSLMDYRAVEGARRIARPPGIAVGRIGQAQRALGMNSVRLSPSPSGFATGPKLSGWALSRCGTSPSTRGRRRLPSMSQSQKAQQGGARIPGTQISRRCSRRSGRFDSCARSG